MPMLAVDFGIC